MRYLVANWKMNQTIRRGEEFLKDFASLRPNQGATKVIISPSFTSLFSLSKYILEKNIPVSLCAQNLSQYKSGAYTGEISVEMVVEAGCSYVILGHSERRHFFLETNETIAQKYHLALESNLIPILCFGETLSIYENKETIPYIENQLSAYHGQNPPILAYEPVWSIGSGLIPTIEEISQVVDFVKDSFPDSSVLYGGSVNLESITKIALISNLGGFLVGGASLKAETFFSLLKALEQADESI